MFKKVLKNISSEGREGKAEGRVLYIWSMCVILPPKITCPKINGTLQTKGMIQAHN